MKPRELLQRIATTPTGVAFKDLERLLRALGFQLDRQRGSHRIYVHPDVPGAMVNLQPDGASAKPYQVRQVLKIVEEYRLGL